MGVGGVNGWLFGPDIFSLSLICDVVIAEVLIADVHIADVVVDDMGYVDIVVVTDVVDDAVVTGYSWTAPCRDASASVNDPSTA